MKSELERIDELIKQALSEEEAAFYEELDEPNLFEKLGEVFKGKLGWIVIMMNIVSLAALSFAVYFAIQLFNTDDTNMLIKFSLGIIFCALMVSMLKLYVWQQMDKNDILRELKKIEFRISALSNR